MCNTIVILNLKNNKIESNENLTFLLALRNLKFLNMNDNPITKKFEKWKEFLKNRLPDIKIAEDREGVI
jgi:hypothetical protein